MGKILDWISEVMESPEVMFLAVVALVFTLGLIWVIDLYLRLAK